MLASWWHPDSSWSSRAMSCQTISPLVILWNSICPIKCKLKWVSWIGRTIPCYTCLFFSNSVPSSSSFKRYSNRKVCCWSSCDSNINWYLCLSSLWFYSFGYFAIIIFIGKMDCLESCVTELRLIKPYHIWLLRAVAPLEVGDLLVGACSGLFPSFLLRNTWLWHRFTTNSKKSNIQLPTSHNQQPTLFWISNTRNLVFITFYCYMVTYTILV